MEFQNLAFNDRLVESTSYSTFYSPPYHSSSSSVIANCSWDDSFAQLSQPFSTDVLQMHHLRFPTPPTTPPKEPLIVASNRLQPEVGFNQRTQSVIMKIGQCQNMYTNLTDIADVDKHGILSSDNKITSSDFMCSWINCKRCFENLENLAAHVNKVHAIASVEDGLYYCRWDGCTRFDRGFNARYKMLVHVRTHTKEKPHHCHLCEKCFSRAENLKIHIRSHSGEKPYICTYEGCQKAYSNSSDRFKHTRTHSMEKPYLCKVPGCQKRYTDPSSLRKHIKTFKHAEQLMDSNLMTHTSAFKTYRERESMDSSSNNEQYNLNSTVDKSYKEQYYVNLTGACCMEEDEFNYYYGVDRKETDTYCLGINQTKYKGSYFVHNVDMDLDKELPLDLRINRSS